MIATSGWLVWAAWRTRGRGDASLPSWLIQLVAETRSGPGSSSACTSPPPPSWRSLLLWAAIAACIALFLHVSRAGPACFLVPYLLWVSFAALLNLALWRLNR